MDRVADIIAGITTVALVTTLVSHRNTARIVTAVGNAYGGALKAAMGQR
jgi:hypothetical protein